MNRTIEFEHNRTKIKAVFTDDYPLKEMVNVVCYYKKNEEAYMQQLYFDRALAKQLDATLDFLARVTLPTTPDPCQ